MIGSAVSIEFARSLIHGLALPSSLQRLDPQDIDSFVALDNHVPENSVFNVDAFHLFAGPLVSGAVQVQRAGGADNLVSLPLHLGDEGRRRAGDDVVLIRVVLPSPGHPRTASAAAL